jgi:excisionase family DNA binding protein
MSEADLKIDGPPITPVDAGHIYGVTDRMVRKLIANRKLGAVRIGKSWRISRAEARAFLERNRLVAA